MRTRQYTIVFVALALSAAPVFAQPPRGGHTAAAVITVEHEWLAALNRRDVTALARILGREFIDSDSQGDAITRAQYLTYFARPISRPSPRVDQRFEDTTVRFVSDGDVAIVDRPRHHTASDDSEGGRAINTRCRPAFSVHGCVRLARRTLAGRHWPGNALHPAQRLNTVYQHFKGRAWANFDKPSR